MVERLVLSYLDLKEDKFKVEYFDSEVNAHAELEKIKADGRYMSEMLMTESEWEEFELEQAISDEEYDD